jgi:hypothetical protein
MSKTSNRSLKVRVQIINPHILISCIALTPLALPSSTLLITRTRQGVFLALLLIESNWLANSLHPPIISINKII